MILRVVDILLMGIGATAAAVIGSQHSWWAGAVAGGIWVGGSAVIVAVRRQRAELARRFLVKRLRRLTDSGMGSASAPSLLPQTGSRDESVSMPHELDELDAQVSDLQRRLTGQMKELAKKSRNLESLIDSLDEPVLVIDDRDTVLMCNQASERVLDQSRRPILGKPIRELLTSSELIAMHRRAKREGTQRARIRLTSPTGTRIVEASVSPLPAAWGDGIFGAIIVLRDVTELATAAQLQTDFVANASHELRTPVASLKAALETLDDGGKHDGPMLDKLLNICTSNVNRLEEMVRDLLDLSRLQTPDMPVRLTEVPLDELRQTMLVGFEAVCQRRKIELNIRFDDSLRGLVTDTKLLSLVLRNLIENATKFAYENTVISVSGSRSVSDPSMARFSVQDQGIGIPLEQQSRVFERFYQVDGARTGFRSNGRGSGLGLAIVKQAVDTLRGRLTLDSAYGEGTTVTVELPITSDVPPAVGVDSPQLVK